MPRYGFQGEAATVGADVRQGADLCLFVAVKALTAAVDMSDLQAGPFGQGPLAADIKGKLDGFSNNAGECADFNSDGKNLLCLLSLGVLQGDIDDILSQSEFVQEASFDKKSGDPRTIFTIVVVDCKNQDSTAGKDLKTGALASE